MKRLFLALLLLLPLLPAAAQETVEENITIIDDEECGCELFFIDSIQTTKRGDRFGFKLADGRELVEPRYMFVDKWHGDYCLALMNYDSTGLLNRQGREVVPCIYQEVMYPTDGMIRVKQADRYGFLAEDGSVAIAPQYSAASTFSEGYAVVAITVDSHFVEYVFIDKGGNIILRDDYQYAYPFFNGFAVVKKYDRYGLIDKQGRMVVHPNYEVLTAVDSNMRYIANNPHGDGLALFSARTFQPITPFVYQDFLSYADGYYLFLRDSVKGFLDTLGRERFGTYDDVGIFHKGYAMVMRSGHYGIIDNEGHTVLPMEYDYASHCNSCYFFQEGLAVVMKDGKFGYCDETGRIVIPIEYEHCFGFSSGLAPVKSKGLWGYINTEGEMVIPFLFDAASPFKYGRAEVYYRGHTSKINTQGRCEGLQQFPCVEYY